MSIERSDIKSLDVPPSEKMVIAAKVNRICSLSADTFNEEVNLPEVNEIVRILDPKLKLSNITIGVELTVNNDETHKTTIAGQTSHGQMNVSYEEKNKDKSFTIGKAESIGIGEYIVTKRKKGKDLRLVFSHFWDFSTSELELEDNNSMTRIIYSGETGQVKQIDKLISIEKYIVGCTLVTQKAIRVWPLTPSI